MVDQNNQEREKKPQTEPGETDIIEFIPLDHNKQGEREESEAKSQEREETLPEEERKTTASGVKSEEGKPASAEKPEKESEEEAKLKHRLKKKEAEIKSLKKERDEWKDKYLRSLADMENMRKRLDRERDEFTRFALASFLKELLLVIDDFERALVAKDETDGRTFQEGVAMIHRRLMDLLRKQGVTPIESESKQFDPNIHQAVFTEEAEGMEEPEVAEYLAKGYWLHDRLLRPALVKVLVPKKRP